jgi:hypothetical protein
MMDTATMAPKALRARLAAMDECELLRFGIAARYRYTHSANQSTPPRKFFSLQLEAAQNEWRRRRPGLPLRDSF